VPAAGVGTRTDTEVGVTVVCDAGSGLPLSETEVELAAPCDAGTDEVVSGVAAAADAFE